MTNSNQAHLVIATLTDEAASKQLCELDTDTIRDLVVFVGGEDAFYLAHEDVAENGINEQFEALSSADETAAIYHKHKAELLRFCDQYADSVGQDSATKLIAKKLGLDGEQALNEINEALNTHNSKTDEVLACVIGIALTEMSAVFADMCFGMEE